MKKVQTEGSLGELAARFIDFIDDQHAEAALRDLGGVETFYAISRLEGASALLQIAGAPDDVLNLFGDARDRYVGLLDGAPELESYYSKVKHALVLEGVKRRAAA